MMKVGIMSGGSGRPGSRSGRGRGAISVLAAVAMAVALMPAEGLAAGGVTIRGSVSSSSPGFAGTGARIALVVVPDSQFQDAALAAGQPIQTAEVASTTSAGSWSLVLDPSALDPMYVADDGHVEVIVDAIFDGKVTSWGMPVQSGQTGAVAVPTLDLDEGDAVSAPGPGPNPPCGQVLWGVFKGPYQTKVLDVYAQGQVPGTGTYMSGSATSTTLGFLHQGLDDVWEVGGTYTESRRTGAGFTVQAKDRRLHALWRYRERTRVCYPGKDLLPWDYVGKGPDLSIPHVSYSWCGYTYRRGSEYFRYSYANQTYSTGLTIFGIGLSSQAGLVSSMTLKFHFNQDGNVCGNNSLRENAPIVEASTY